MKIFITRSGKWDSLEEVRVFSKDCSTEEAVGICKSKTSDRDEKYWSITTSFPATNNINLQFESGCPTQQEWDDWENEYGQ